VCVLPMGRVDDCVALAETTGVIFTTFGDARPTAPQRSPAATARVSRRRTSCKAPATKAAKSQKPQTSCTARPLFSRPLRATGQKQRNLRSAPHYRATLRSHDNDVRTCKLRQMARRRRLSGLRRPRARLQHHRVSLQTTCPAGDSLTQDRAKHSNIDRVP